MRIVVVGLGVQGRKRVRIAAADVVATVDPVTEGADHRSLDEVSFDDFDAALLCVPDGPKPELLQKLVAAGKHVLVEKPLVAAGGIDLDLLENDARRSGSVVYSAYNHRFEPHLARLAGLVREGAVGIPYRLSMLYGNGTARDVQSSPWRDRGLGVVTDLAPHLLDLCLFLTGEPQGPVRPWSVRAHENAACDAFVLGFPEADPLVVLEGTLLSWRNTFRLDLLGSEGSAHVSGLCKWGPTTLTLRTRVLPSGKPPERSWTLEQADPTWELEYAHFLALCAVPIVGLAGDRFIDRVLGELTAAATAT
ncbi:MAG TPA: Gfo/Idh/MocA family oxidoreductase [Plantibacter sp.]|uniref:Gfo/Idh/MocA family protein n=1 Tax=Plantibacter sp. TaxID=1871045 RepID=UPI002B59DE77|nr:Gfo/Idh/MocA family oxidoreductase [Plantibacter sp.]